MSNVVAFALRHQEVPALRRAEVRLSEDCRIVELTVLDEMGKAEVLEYALASSSPNFDFGRLRRSWDEWRGSPPAAVS
jgi:hypothetical protein